MLVHISAEPAVSCVHVRSIDLSTAPNSLACSTDLTWPMFRRTVCRNL